MSNNISSFIHGQVPDYLSDTDSLFTEFLETYYRYCQLRENSLGLVLYHQENLDIDSTLDKYVEKFYRSYGLLVPREMAIDKKTFIKLLGNLYDAKGTEKSFKYLFRLLFNTNIDIYYPRDQMLKASSGQWEQQSFITVYTNFGSLTGIGTADIAEIKNSTGVYYITVDRVQEVENSRTRIYFKKTQDIKITTDSVLSIRADGSLVYRASIEKSPVRISVLESGAKFQSGQIYNITGLQSDTIFKVTSITKTGGVKSASILFHGIGNVTNQQSYVSSYKNTPPNNGSSVTTLETSPGVFTHSISAFDIIYGILERVSAQQIGVTPQSYFSEDYVEIEYSANSLFDQYFTNSTEPTASNLLLDINTSFDQYLLDRAKIQLDYDYVAVLPGRYISNAGHISDEFIRLQDSKYYQIFSYVIRSRVDVSRYRDTVLKMLHPAGLRAFSSLQYDYYLSIKDKIGVDGKYIYRLNFDEAAYSVDSFVKLFGKKNQDNVDSFETIEKSALLPKSNQTTASDLVNTAVSLLTYDSLSVGESTALSTSVNFNETVNGGYSPGYYAQDYEYNASVSDSIVVDN